MTEFSKKRWGKLAGIPASKQNKTKMQAKPSLNESGDGPYRTSAKPELKKPGFLDKLLNHSRCSKCGDLHAKKDLRNPPFAIDSRSKQCPECLEKTHKYYDKKRERILSKENVADKLPETAEEYAKSLNAKSNHGSKLVDEPEFWEARDIHTAYDLKLYLAQESFRGAYKMFFGHKPSAAAYEGLTADQVQELIDELYEEFSND